MNGRKIYEGEQYQFIRKEPSIGKGGNGAVYDVDIEGFHYPIVAKFFEYKGNDVERRYKRFKKEIETMSIELKDCKGVIQVLDKNCPQNVPQKKDSAWFLMPKAESYKVNRNRYILDKLDDMLQLACIIESIHKKGLAHRDIKPENILVLNKRLYLSDFGLVWGAGTERLTKTDERLGPYRIIPPELEQVHLDMLLDFRPSDVYLFAKVVWMTIKEDNIGFRGEYSRGDIQIYLDKTRYNVLTFEPIHKLLEEATYEVMDKRITIEKCIKYLELQKQIVVRNKREQLPAGFVQQLQYEENNRKIISKIEPDSLVYERKPDIYKVLEEIISVANVYIKNLSDERAVSQIQISDFSINSDGTCQLLYFYNGKKVKEYLCSIKKMTYSKKEELIILDLNDVNIVDQEYISFAESQKGFGNIYSRIILESNENIIITKPFNNRTY